MRKKAQANLALARGFMLGLIVILVLGIVALIVFNSIASANFNLSGSGPGTFSNQSNTETELLANGTSGTLSSTPDALNSVTANNDTWIELNRLNDGWATDASYINISQLMGSSTFAGSFSVTMWVNATNTLFSPDLMLMTNKENWDIQSRGFMIGFAGSNFEIQAHNGTNFSTPAVNFEGINRWHFYTAVWNGTNSVVYINATAGTTGAYAPGSLINATEELMLGGGFSTGIGQNALNGRIDEVRIYNRVLTQAEISNIWTSGRIPNASLPNNGLIAWYSMNENSGTNVIDRTNNSFNGTLIDRNSGNGLNYGYASDGVTNALTGATNFTQSGTTFTLVNPRYSWALLTVNYNTTSQAAGTITADLNAVGGNGTAAVKKLFSSAITWAVVVSIIILISILALALVIASRIGKGG